MSDGSVDQTRGLLSRRRLLKGAAGVAAIGVMPGVLAACGSDSGTTSSSATTAGGSTAAESTGTVGGSLDYFGWEGVDLPEVLAPWKKDNGVDVHSSYIGGLKDIPAKYAGGGANGFDILGASSNGVPLMLESGVPLMPLDKSQLPNLAGMNPFFRDSKALQNENGELVAVPFSWGVMGISYDSTKISEPKSWNDMLDPSLKNKITILDDAFTVFGTAAPTLGLQFEAMTQEDFEKVKSYIAEVLTQVRTISPSFGDMANVLASGEVVAGWCGYTSINAFAEEAGNPNIRTAIKMPEGSASFAEIYCIPETGQNPDTAYSMINEVLDPTINAEAADALVLAPTIDASWSKVNSTIKGLFPKSASERTAVLEKAPLVVNPPLQSTEYVTFAELEQAWLELKSA